MSQHDRDALLARLDEDISVAEQLEPAEWRLICGLAEPLAKLDETTRPHVMLGHIERGSAHWQRQLGRFYVGVYEPLLALQAFDRAVALDRDDCGALADAANLLSVLGLYDEMRSVIDQLLARASRGRGDAAAIVSAAALLSRCGFSPEAAAFAEPHQHDGGAVGFVALQTLGEARRAVGDARAAKALLREAARVGDALDERVVHFERDERWAALRDAIRERAGGQGLVVFEHIYKCAGASMHASLQQALGPSRCFDLYHDPFYARLWRNVEAAAERGEPPHGMRLVHHHLPLPLRQRWLRERRQVTLLREPLARWFSAYRYEKANYKKAGTQAPAFYESYDAYIRVMSEQCQNREVFARHLLVHSDVGTPETLDVVRAAGELLTVAPDDAELAERAHAAYAQRAFVGMQEHFVASLVCIAALAGADYVPLMARVNATPPSREQMSDDARRYTEAHNAVDLALYARAREAFETDYADVIAACAAL